MSYAGQSISYSYPAGVTIADVQPDYMKHLIHPHWNNYPPVNPMWHYLLGVIYIFLGICAFTGNAVVIYLYLKVKKLRTPSNLLVFNLAVLDFHMVLTNYPAFIYNSLSGGMWMLPAAYCQIYGFCGFTTGNGAIGSLAFITYDRYNVIVHGVSGKPLTWGRAYAMVALVWIYGAGTSIPPFLGWGRYIPEGLLYSCTTDYLSTDFNNRSYGIFVCFWTYILPLACLIYFYFYIVKCVVAHESAMRAQAKKMNVTNLRSGGSDGESAEMRVAKVAVFNVSLWILCWTPYFIVNLQGLFFDASKITPLVSMLPAVLAKSCSTYNPMVYALGHPRFRAAMQEHVSWCCINEPEAPSDNASNKSTETATPTKE